MENLLSWDEVFHRWNHLTGYNMYVQSKPNYPTPVNHQKYLFLVTRITNVLSCNFVGVSIDGILCYTWMSFKIKFICAIQ